MAKCNTISCENKAEYTVYWPGEVPPPIYCKPCAGRAVAIANAMGSSVAISKVGEETNG